MKTFDNFIDGPHTFDPEARFYTKDRALERQSYSEEMLVPPESIRFNIEETAQGYLKARILHYVYQEDLGTYTHTLAMPASWWDHFKRDCMPEWFIERYPVKMIRSTVRLQGHAIFPEFRPPNGYSQVRYVLREVDRNNRPYFGDLDD